MRKIQGGEQRRATQPAPIASHHQNRNFPKTGNTAPPYTNPSGVAYATSGGLVVFSKKESPTTTAPKGNPRIQPKKTG